MPDKGGSAASLFSAVSPIMGAAGDVMGGYGTKASDDFQAAKAERAAEFGKINATTTDTVMREQLATVLGNIDAARAAGNVDPTSPTTVAIADRNRQVSDRQRTTAIASIDAQVAEDEASARYLRQAGDYAVTQGYIKGGTRIASAIAKGMA